MTFDFDRIRRQRRLRKLKQSEFARLIGVSAATIGHWERGHSYPSVQDLIHIAEVVDDYPHSYFIETLKGRKRHG